MKAYFSRKSATMLVLVLTVSLSVLVVGCRQDEPVVAPDNLVLESYRASSTVIPGRAPAGPQTAAPKSRPELAIAPEVTETGQVSLSTDALGITGASGTLEVLKPVGATVRSAYMAAASTGFTGHVIADGDITINGNGVNWDIAIANAIASNNYWADVTAIVKPIVDAAGAGTVNLTIGETSSGGIDGSLIAVIFDDPNQTTDNTIVLLFGAQDIAGDMFTVNLADPLDTSDPDLILDMCLGISYGFQPGGQVSLVDVNGQRLTSSAGGHDDGAPANGALMTVGGVGDTNGNPPPFAVPITESNPDDELYDLLPFVSNGDTQIDVFSINPSNDDNILFACFFLTVEASIGEVIVDLDIKPTSCPNPLNIKNYDPDKPKKGGLLPVAILGTAGFDVNDIDVSTITLEGVTPVRNDYEDVATPFDGPECDCTTEGPDGFTDLTLKFQKSSIIAAILPQTNASLVPLTISGTLLDGTPFSGVDCVLIRGVKDTPNMKQ